MASFFPAALLDEAAALLVALERRSLLLATAESCTGGLLGGLFTEIPGSSAVFDRGFVTYSDTAKTEMLGVDPDLIERHGAVSREIADAMARGALNRSPAHIALAITGIAGPSGGSLKKPVGRVYLCAARKEGAAIDRECNFGNIGRAEVRLASLEELLALARTALDQSPP